MGDLEERLPAASGMRPQDMRGPSQSHSLWAGFPISPLCLKKKLFGLTEPNKPPGSEIPGWSRKATALEMGERLVSSPSTGAGSWDPPPASPLLQRGCPGQQCLSTYCIPCARLTGEPTIVLAQDITNGPHIQPTLPLTTGCPGCCCRLRGASGRSGRRLAGGRGLRDRGLFYFQ